MVFSPRDLIIESEPEHQRTREWVERSTMVHSKFKPLGTTNDGRQLFCEYQGGEFRGNWIGEPSSVMLRKECFDRLGPFNSRICQICDIEMWLRIMAFYDVGFIQERLSAFRFHSDSASHANITMQKNRLDQLRLLESLLRFDEIRIAYPELQKMRRRERVRIILRRIVPLQIRRKILAHFRSA